MPLGVNWQLYIYSVCLVQVDDNLLNQLLRDQVAFFGNIVFFRHPFVNGIFIFDYMVKKLLYDM